MAPRDNLKAGERRVATILFSDMKGFTSLSERLDPEVMDGLMNRVFGLFEGIIKSHGGFVEKYIGDALVAVFGVPELHEDDPSRAIHAALEFLARVCTLDDCLQAREPGISFRTGIHTGLVTTGKRGDFDVVTGHAMSVAQRLEAAAPPDTILVSDATKEKCEADFTFEGPVELTAKGKAEHILAFRVTGESAGEARESGPLVGRGAEIDELLRAYLRSRSDEASGFWILGETGVGKTRLVQALMDKLRLFPDYKTPILAARAQKYRPGEFAVIIDLLEACCGLDAGAPPEALEAALAGLPSLRPETRRHFAALAGGRAEAEGRTEQGSMAALVEIFDALLARHGGDLFPVLVFVDNASFMDRASLEFFQYVLRKARVKPFLVFAGRDFPPELRKLFSALKPLKLGPLPKPESEALVRAWWPDATPEGMARILEAGAGNPLFLREYAAYARKHRDLSALPATVQNLLLASLERYPAAMRDLARKLSVFIHSWTEDDARRIEEATGGDPAAVEAALARFAEDGLAVRDRERWTFRVDAFKKALYASLLNHNKRVLHAQVADILLTRERPHRIRLVHHLIRAERYEEAARALQEDPNRNHTFDYLPYIETLLRRLKGEERDRLRLLVVKSTLLFNRGRYDEAEAVLKRILRTAVRRKDDFLMGFAYHQICAHNLMDYSLQKAVFTGQKSLHYYRRSEVGVRGVQNVLRTMALAQALRGESEEARRLVLQCEGVPGGDPHEAAEARAEVFLIAGDYDKALEVVDRSLAALPEERSAARFFDLDLKLKALWQRCDFQGLAPVAREILTQGSLSGSVLSQANAMLALSLFLYGDKERAADSFLQAEFYAGQIGNDFEKIDALRTLALCRALSGDVRRAEHVAGEALTIGLRHSCYWPAFTLLMLLVESSLERGREDRARFFLDEASYTFTVGMPLPHKDLILYYWFASRLLSPCDAERHRAVAFRLLEEEKARVGDPELIANFLAIRSFGLIQKEADGVAAEPGGPAGPLPAACADGEGGGFGIALDELPGAGHGAGEGI
jgi:class 3 adenylate cyclase/tetratricopeptide (TPR) repeat protein